MIARRYGLPPAYDDRLVEMLRAVGTTRGVRPEDLTGFWPRVGHEYVGRLLVVGRAVNGWIDHTTVTRLGEAGGPERFAATIRRTADAEGACPLSWVTEAWGRRDGYNTKKSAFWRFAREALIRLEPEAAADPRWSGRLAWSNLTKIAPWERGNPPTKLLRLQREYGPRLFAHEVLTYRPENVLVTTGRWWFEPFAAELGLDVEWRADDVGYAQANGTRYLVAPHPQGARRTTLNKVLEAL
ncbi:MAG: hypothetical protein PVH07_08910 [Chloroflexota bacterium]